MVIDSDTINHSVDTDETVIAKILNKNQLKVNDVMTEKCRRKANNEVIMKMFCPILII